MSGHLLVLDVHGVVLNNPLPVFMQDLALRLKTEAVHARWRSMRRDFWEGRLDETAFWSRLAPTADAVALRSDLESRYAPGPYYAQLMKSDHRIWLLSNHRHAWLMPRLQRFGLAERFERVLVSDQLGAAKPSIGAFAPLVDAAATSQVTFVDDNPRNVAAARAEGLNACLADAQTDWAALTRSGERSQPKC